ncbi:hypothetical protein [Streptosporangium sp. NPDC051022]|uniref:hypothetical protein n=1 Tax=Streptosporangium sp. NPDC051022 TaxID=3155752 RepID=UPI0034224172
MSKQTTFTLTFLVGLSVIVPGCAGYLSAKMDAVERAHRELVSLETRIRQERLVPPGLEADQDDNEGGGEGETIAVPGTVPCDIAPQSPPRQRRDSRTAALVPAPTGLPAGEPEPRDPVSGGRAPLAAPRQDGLVQDGDGERSQSAAHEHRRRHRDRQERIGASGCVPAPQGASSAPGQGVEGSEVSGPSWPQSRRDRGSQTEAPEN